MDSFSKSHDKFWKELGSGDTSKVTERTGVIYDEGRKAFLIDMMGETFFIDPDG